MRAAELGMAQVRERGVIEAKKRRVGLDEHLKTVA